jgi:hypothetical protein
MKNNMQHLNEFDKNVVHLAVDHVIVPEIRNKEVYWLCKWKEIFVNTETKETAIIQRVCSATSIIVCLN